MSMSWMVKPTACTREITSLNMNTPEITIIASLTMPAKMKLTAELCFTNSAMTTLSVNAMHELASKCGHQCARSASEGRSKSECGVNKWIPQIDASFIIWRKATDECKYAELLRASCPEKKIAIGKAPFRIRSRSSGTLRASSVSDGKRDGFTRYRKNDKHEQKQACMKTRGTAKGNLSLWIKNLLYEIRPDETTMYPAPREQTRTTCANRSEVSGPDRSSGHD
mmetsp:Transcript_61569/g.199327  ORF Transcript_61569/g.199327 Transcript_61569/m.199327 type:complete len:224 (+) Transcript_61569:345-1016(+)